jgi:hypothetical protein
MGNHKVIPETWKGSGSAAPLAKSLRDLGGVMNNVRGINGVRAFVRGGRLVIDADVQSSMDFSQFCFGFSISGATVTIIGGDWPIGNNAPLELEDTDITISQDLQYVGLEVDTIAKTIMVIGPSTSKAVFNPDGMKFRTWLHLFNYSAGSISLKKTKLGSLIMPSTFGAPS